MMKDNKAIDIIQSGSEGLKPQVGIIFGSGLGAFTEDVKG